ncbi:MAG: extracellular solute-binding protein [Defluviitaleaceae bacterium]|nr:extracellular solute-binding protein [Defluviitaleaceae bacterium]
MKKLFLVLPLVFLLAFAACGGNEADAPGGDQQAEATAPPTTTEESPAVNRWGLPIELGGGRLHEARDFGEKTLVIGAWWDTPIGAIAWGEEPDRATSTNYPVARMMWDNARRVEEVFNVRFEPWVVGFDDYLPTLFSTVIAGVPAADVVILEGWMQLEAMGSIIQPWDNANLPNSDILGAQVFGGPRTQNDAGVWAIYQHGVMAESFGLGINLDLINAEGLPNPIDLFEAGEWTWEAMLDIMRRATRDTTGDGVIDQFGIAGQPGEIVQHLIAANDGTMVDYNLNYGFSHPNTIVALEFAQQIFGERLWYAEAGGIMDTGNWNRNFYSGFEDGVAAMFPSIVWAFQNSPPAFNFGFVPFPTGPNNRTGNTWSRGTLQGVCVVVGTSWDVADILILLEELYSWPCDEPELLFEAGGIDWLRDHFLTEEDVQRVVYAGITSAADIGRDIDGYYWVLGDFASHFWNNEMDVMQAVEYHRGPRQEMLDQRFR